MHFLGPIRGVLPLGPNGVASLNTLESSPFDDTNTAAAMISYNYTLNHQGFASNITCIYNDQSPILFWTVRGDANMVAYNASCSDLGLANVLTNVVDYVTLNTNNTLTFWACKSVPTDGEELIYHVYLRGRENYASFTDITCLVSSTQLAIFPVEYQSAPSIFSSSGEPNATFANMIPGLVERALGGLGAVIRESQNLQSNLVAESVITFGVKKFQLQPYERNGKYLQLYEAMIKGIIEYEVCLMNQFLSSFLCSWALYRPLTFGCYIRRSPIALPLVLAH